MKNAELAQLMTVACRRLSPHLVRLSSNDGKNIQTIIDEAFGRTKE